MKKVKNNVMKKFIGFLALFVGIVLFNDMLDSFLIAGGSSLAFALPVCSTSCSDDLPIVSFDECNPEINGGQVSKLYITNVGYPLTDVTDAVEWGTRLDNAGAGNDAIRTLHVVGSKPAPSGDEKEISLGRKLKGSKTHIVNFKIDETNDVNHEFLRKLECGGTFKFWYETLEGKIFGGNEGIDASFFVDMVIPEAATDIIINEGKAEWKAKFTEERNDSPLA
ncbi:MAG: hypothetical protein KC589_09375 [Nanoarchaeota archaeon]|nr:hypothetical protein [Nanoarchaeota archaeon]